MVNKLTIIIPVYFNERNLPTTYNKIKESVMDKVSDCELILVDDGSLDKSYEVMQQLYEQDSRIKLVKLSRNFGHHQAILAGLNHMSGDCVAIISADLQDPPILILQMYQKWLDGNKVILAIREGRDEPLIQRFFSATYYKMMRKFALKDMPEGGFDCVLIDKQVAEVLMSIDEKNTSLFAQILWLGFKRETITYIRQKREIGTSRWTLSKKIKLFIDSLLAFSYVPIRLISLCGILISMLSIIFSIIVIVHKLLYGSSVLGWSSIMVAIIFSCGIQMLTLGIIGEYLWRNFDATRKRPNYIIEDTTGIK